MKQIFHRVEEWNHIEDDWKWAVMWKNKVVCFSNSEGKAEAISWALDTAKPYFTDNDNEDEQHE